MSGLKTKITKAQQATLIDTLKERFESNRTRHADIAWSKVHTKLEAS